MQIFNIPRIGNMNMKLYLSYLIFVVYQACLVFSVCLVFRSYILNRIQLFIVAKENQTPPRSFILLEAVFLFVHSSV